jgi:hypothetical protein
MSKKKKKPSRTHTRVSLSNRSGNRLRDKGGGVSIGNKSTKDKNELFLQVYKQSNVQFTMLKRSVYYYGITQRF